MNTYGWNFAPGGGAHPECAPIFECFIGNHGAGECRGHGGREKRCTMPPNDGEGWRSAQVPICKCGSRLTRYPDGFSVETHYHPLMTRLRQMDMTFVTAINGPAVGVGMSLAIMSDYAVASDNAYFLQAFANIGLVPDGGVTYAPRLVGGDGALHDGRAVPRRSGLEWGLINKVVARFSDG